MLYKNRIYRRDSKKNISIVPCHSLVTTRYAIKKNAPVHNDNKNQGKKPREPHIFVTNASSVKRFPIHRDRERSP